MIAGEIGVVALTVPAEAFAGVPLPLMLKLLLVVTPDCSEHSYRYRQVLVHRHSIGR
jgi:hypothetical protein